jgi:FAD/FMN-containing dehydrogenase
MVSLDNLNDLQEILPKIIELKPSILDMINRAVVDQVTQLNPQHLTGLLGNPRAAVHLFVEFDGSKDSEQKKSIRQLAKLVNKVGGMIQTAETPEEQEKIWKVRQSVSSLLAHPQRQRKAVPVAEDVSVPVAALVEFMQKAGEIYAAAELMAPVWGSAGDGVVRMQPTLDLGQIGDRQKLFKLADSIYRSAIEMGGSITAAAGDGRVRAAYTRQQYGSEIHDLMMKVKKICDPYGILNPGVKTASADEVKALMRGDYNLAHRHEFLPRS